MLHDYTDDKEISCVISQISFDNPLAKKGFELMFCLKPYEQLDAVEITETGIKAHISKRGK